MKRTILPRGQEGFADQRLLMGLGALGITALAAKQFMSEDETDRALLPILAAGILGAPLHSARKFAAVADRFAGNISTTVRNISPAVLRAARDFEMRNLTEARDRLNRVAGWMKELNKVGGKDRAELERALLNNDREAIARMQQGRPELVAGWREVRNVLREMGEKLGNYGRFKSMREDYFPRVVKDLEGLKAALDVPMRTRLEKALAEAEQAAMRSRGTPLSNIERSAIVNREIQGFRRAGGYQPGFAKSRRVEEITEALQPFYMTPSESLYAYIRAGTQDLEMARLFGKNLVQSEKGGAKYIDTDASIGNLVGEELAAGRIDPAGAQKLTELLQSRFKGGERSPDAWVQGIRNLSNMGLLGNIVSAATQGADAAMAVYAHGFRATLASLARQFSGRQRVTTHDFGLADHVVEEFTSQGRTANWLNKMLKSSGFSAIDRFGKNTQLGAALSKYERLAQSERGVARIKEKYGEAYGNELPQLVADLREGRISERVRSLLFSELSDMQPISKLELPQAYLDHPNGRLMYQLKSFMLKQMDVVRRDVYDNFRAGKRARALERATSYALVLGLAGASTDMIKDWLLGRNPHFDTGDVLENVLKTFGWGEFVRDKLSKGKGLQAAAGTLMPPQLSMLDTIKDDIQKGTFKSVQYIPILGKLYYSWELGGREEAELAQARKDKKAGKEPRLSPRAELYKERKLEKQRERREKQNGY